MANESPQVAEAQVLQAMMNQPGRLQPLQALQAQMNDGAKGGQTVPHRVVTPTAATTTYTGDAVLQASFEALSPAASLTENQKVEAIDLYLKILPGHKARLQGENNWSGDMDTAFDEVDDKFGDDEYNEAYAALGTLIGLINALPGGAGGGAVALSAEQQTEVVDAGWAAKPRAIALATSLVANDDLIKSEFVVDDAGVPGIKAVINKIKAHLSGMPKEKFIADADGSLLASGAGAVNRGKGADAVVMFTMAFKNSSASEQSATLFHEAGHGTPDVTALDIAYVGSWAAEGIAGDAAKQNAPSYERALLQQAHDDDDTGAVAAPARKTLAADDVDQAHIPKLVTTLAKLDHQITQAWWYANNLRGFLIRYKGQDLKPVIGQTLPQHIIWYAGQIGLSVKADVSGQRKVTSADIEVGKAAVKVMANRKNAVGAFAQFEKSDAVDPLTIAGNKLTINSATLALTPVEIGKKIIAVLDVNQGVIELFKGYDKMSAMSDKKDQIEGAAAPRI